MIIDLPLSHLKDWFAVMIQHANVHEKIPTKSVMEGLNVTVVIRQSRESEACQNPGLHKYSRLPRSGPACLSIMWQVNTHAHTTFQLFLPETHPNTQPANSLQPNSCKNHKSRPSKENKQISTWHKLVNPHNEVTKQNQAFVFCSFSLHFSFHNSCRIAAEFA